MGRTAARAGAQHVNAIDRASRGGPVRAFLSGDDMWLKVALVALALMGVAVAAEGVAGVVLVAAVALLAVVPASIAEDRGGRWMAWYVYGVLIFPLAVGHALMLPTPDEQRGASSGDRQLRALVGGAAALFIAIGVGWITGELAASDAHAHEADRCYELAYGAVSTSDADDRAALSREAAACRAGQ